MRVLHVLGEAAGAEWLALETIGSLKGSRLEQHVVLSRSRRRASERLRAAGIDVTRPGLLAGRGAFGRLLAQAEARFAPDIIQYWSAPPADALPRGHAATVAWQDAADETLSAEACAYHAAADRRTFDRLRAAGVNPAHIALARPFSRLEDRAATTHAPSRPPGRCLRLHLSDGATDAASWIAAVARGPDWRLALSGDAHAVRGAARLARRHGIPAEPAEKTGEPALVLIPHTNEIPEPLIADAWTAGWPVVAAGEMGGLLLDEANALLAEPGAQSEIAGQIARGLGDDAARARLRLGGLESYECHFAKSRFLERLVGLYDRAVLGRDDGLAA